MLKKIVLRCHACSIVRDFEWFKAPIANVYSRLAMVTNANDGTLALMGTDGATPVTPLFSLLQAET